MRFIRAWSYKCAHYLAQQLNESHERRGVYYYGFQVVIGAVVKGVMLVLAALLAGALIPTIAVTLFFVSLRGIAGGYHMDTYDKCIAVSLAMFVLGGVIVEYSYMYWPSSYVMALAVVTFAAGLYSVIKWAPKDTPNKPIKSPERIRKFKILSIIHIFIWIAAELLLLHFNLKIYALAGCIGILLAIFIISPVGHRFFDMLSGRMDKVKKR
jgi:accessory gene regulator B